MDVNYKNQKRYKTAKYPIRQPIYLTFLIWFLSAIMLIGKKKKIEKKLQEGLGKTAVIGEKKNETESR